MEQYQWKSSKIVFTEYNFGIWKFEVSTEKQNIKASRVVLRDLGLFLKQFYHQIPELKHILLPIF